MKRFYRQFRIMLLTLALGLASVPFFTSLSERWSEVSVELPVVESESLITVFPQEHQRIFRLKVAGCGGWNIYGGQGGAAGFETEDGQKVSIDSSYYDKKKGVQRELQIRLQEANQIIEITQAAHDYSEKLGKRIILKNGKENKHYEILRYDGNKSIRTIYAPTLKLALEFENYLLEKEKRFEEYKTTTY